MWTGALFLARRVGLGYERSASVAFTAAGNNFELAIAVAISVFGVTSGQALAGVVARSSRSPCSSVSSTSPGWRATGSSALPSRRVVPMPSGKERPVPPVYSRGEE